MSEPRYPWWKPVSAGAGVVLLIGLLVLLIPASVSAGSSSVSCGNAVVQSDAAALRDSGGSIADAITGSRTSNANRFEDLCAAKLATKRIIGWPLVVIGGAVLVGVAVAPKNRKAPAESRA